MISNNIKRPSLENINNYLKNHAEECYYGMFSINFLNKLLLKTKPFKIYIHTDILSQLIDLEEDKVDKINKAIITLTITKESIIDAVSLCKMVGGINHIDGKYYISGNSIDIEVYNKFKGIVAVDKNENILGVYDIV